MKILDNSERHLSSLLPRLVSERLDKRIDKIKFVGGGSYGRVYKVLLCDKTAIAVKIYRIQKMQHEEAQQLRLLSENTSVKMPEVLFTYEDENTAILAMSFVEGKNVLSPAFLFKSKSRKQKFARDVVDGMLEWHNVTNDKYGSLFKADYDSWREYYKNECQLPWLEALKGLAEKGKFSRKKLKLLYEATELFDELPEESTTPVLIHADLNIMNIMAEPETMELTAFIDPCGSMWADREYDLFQFRNMWGDAYGIYEAYKSKCRMSQFTDFRVAYYGAMLEASMRLKGGHTVPLWEDLNFIRLRKEMKKLKEKK